MDQEQPEPRVVAKGRFGIHLDKFSRRNDVNDVRMFDNDVRILFRFFENQYLGDWNFGEWLNLVQGFIAVDRKNIYLYILDGWSDLLP